MEEWLIDNDCEKFDLDAFLAVASREVEVLIDLTAGGRILHWAVGDEGYVEAGEFMLSGREGHTLVHTHPYVDRRSRRASRTDLRNAGYAGFARLLLLCAERDGGWTITEYEIISPAVARIVTKWRA